MVMSAGKAQVVRPARSRRGIWVTSVVVVAVLALSVGAWAMWKSHNKQKLLASLDDPRKVREAVDQGQISREEARGAFMQAMEARMDKTMNEYFALPSGPQRQKYLDNMIDEMEARRREWQSRATTRPTTRPERDGERQERPDREPSEARQREWAARGDRVAPERRAQRAEFMRAMMQRAQQRGIQPGRGGPGGWGGRGGGGGNRGANR